MSEYLPLRCVTVHLTNGTHYSTNVSALSTDEDLRAYFRKGLSLNLGSEENPEFVRIARLEIHPDAHVGPIEGQIVETITDGEGQISLVIRDTGTDQDGVVILRTSLEETAEADFGGLVADAVHGINRRRRLRSLRPLLLRFRTGLFGLPY